MRTTCVSLSAAGAAGICLSPAALAVDPIFVNATSEAGVTSSHATGGFSNANYAGGGCVGDFNNDGFMDFLHISGGNGNQLDKLYINQGDGTFVDQAAAWGLVLHKGKGASAADYNGDGWIDIFETSAENVDGSPSTQKLYRNNGDNTFTEVGVASGVGIVASTAWGVGWGDYDLDGDLDAMMGASASNNSQSKLFRNNGDGTFTDVTAASQIFQGVPGMFAFSPRFIDVNGDRYPDMSLVADFNTDRFFLNDGDGTFSDATFATGVFEVENGMGQTSGDYNSDGAIDMYHTSIYFPAIGWTGNKLYINDGAANFTEIAAAAGCTDGGYGWGALSVDFDHDGDQDIAETNGDGAGSGSFFGEQSYLWLNNGDGTSYTEVAIASGLVHEAKGRGMVNLDYDNDGDQDVIIFANNEPMNLYKSLLMENEADDRNWIRIFLDTSGSDDLAPNGWHAKVALTATIGGETKTQYRDQAPGDNFLSNSEYSVHFGLGDATTIDSITVMWPNGEETSLGDVAINQTLTISSAEEDCLADFNGDGSLNILDFVAYQAGFASMDPRADCNEDGSFNILDFVCFQGAFAAGCD